MHPFTVLADPVRRRIVEVLAGGERAAGEVVATIGGEFGISQSAVSQQLRVLREHGFARVRPEGARRLYTLDAAAMVEVDAWLDGVGRFWSERLADLAAEVEAGPTRVDAASDVPGEHVPPAARPRMPVRPRSADESEREESSMELGAFSVSLAVRDLEASRAFYERLGFRPIGGDAAAGWLVLANGGAVIGLFQGMFEKNILTFNPGWDAAARPLESFTDVRELQRRLRAEGVAFVQEAEEGSTGPASFVIEDPDGNPILVDQHV